MEQNKGPELNPHKYGQLIFDKGAKNRIWAKNNLEEIVLEKLDIHMQNNESGPLPYTTQKINSRTSLVAGRICLPMQGTRVRALVWEDPTCHGATKPMRHNY